MAHPPYEAFRVHLFSPIGDNPISFFPSTVHHSLGFSFMSHSYLPAGDPSPHSQICMDFSSKKVQCPGHWKGKAGGGAEQNAQCRRLLGVEKELHLF